MSNYLVAIDPKYWDLPRGIRRDPESLLVNFVFQGKDQSFAIYTFPDHR